MFVHVPTYFPKFFFQDANKKNSYKNKTKCLCAADILAQRFSELCNLKRKDFF